MCAAKRECVRLHEWLREQVAANRHWDELVRDLLTTSGTSTERPEVGYYIVNMGEDARGRSVGPGASGCPSVFGHSDWLREVPQPSPGKIYAG